MHFVGPQLNALDLLLLSLQYNWNASQLQSTEMKSFSFQRTMLVWWSHVNLGAHLMHYVGPKLNALNDLKESFKYN